MTIEIKSILLGVTGGIAAYKAADLCSKLTQAKLSVRVAFSRNAERFVAPLVFEALSGHPVYSDVFNAATAYQMEHISWARWADAYVIAPASADIIARMASGQSADPLTTLYLAFRGPVFIAPSMNTAMFEHPATQANMATLSSRGVTIIPPGVGALACGETGSGRMAEPQDIMAFLNLNPSGLSSAVTGVGHPASARHHYRPTDQSLEGRTVLITSGPTREYLDPVRFISNPSSGKMGLALANEAMRRGAKVYFITGPVDSNLIPTDNCEVHQVEAAREMLQKVQELKAQCDIFIFAAAVGDFRAAQPVNRKIKRSGNSISLPLVENPDISQEISVNKQPGQVCIGFAAETTDHESNAQAKLQRKQLDAIVLNDILNPTIGFSSEENEVSIYFEERPPITITRRPKHEVAYEILRTAVQLLNEKA